MTGDNYPAHNRLSLTGKKPVSANRFRKINGFNIPSLNALSYNIINGIFVLFTLVKVEVIWFDTFISD